MKSALKKRTFRPSACVRWLGILPLSYLLCFLTLPTARSQQAPAVAAGSADAAVADAAMDIYDMRRKGLEAMADGIYRVAARFFERYRDQAGKREPDLTDATMLLVQAHLLGEDTTAAMAALKHYDALLSPGASDPYYRDSLQYWRAAVQLDAGSTRGALLAAAPLVKGDKTTPEFKVKAWHITGDAHARREEWDDARQAYAAILQSFPDYDDLPGVKFELAQVFIAQQNYAKAAELLDNIAATAGSELRIRVKLNQVVLETARNNLAAALALYRGIEAERPRQANREWWTALSQLAEKLAANGKFEDALPVTVQAQPVAPRPTDKLRMKLLNVQILVELKKFELAIQALQGIVNDYPDAPEAVPAELKLAELLKQQELYTQAAGHFEKVALQAKAPPEIRYQAAMGRGWCFISTAKFEEAIQAFSHAAKLSTLVEEQAQAYYLAADAAVRSENFTNAAMLFQNVADNYPESRFAEQSRLRQAQARGADKLYSSAAQIYRQFLEQFPTSEHRQKAILERGIALRNSGDFTLAVTELADFVEKYPDSQQTPQVLMEAFAAAKAGARTDDANQFLSTLLQKYPESPLVPHALYQRTHLHFLHGNDAQAVADGKLFLGRFEKLPLAADIMLWLGDYHANLGEHEQAEQRYMQVVSTHPKLPQAHQALYEAASSAFKRHNPARALVLLVELEGQATGETAATVQTRARILHGDILAEQGKFVDALAQFDQALQLTQNGLLAFTARGRAGDMHYAIASQTGIGEISATKELATAAEMYAKLVNDEIVPGHIRESARYRLAKTEEKAGQMEAALEHYLEIVYQYNVDLEDGKVRDWYYFVRAGYDAARLLLLSEDLEDAARVYERLAKAAIPTATDAAARAAEIRQSLQARRDDG